MGFGRTTKNTLSCLGGMRTREPRRELAGNGAETLRPGTSNTVHDHGKPSRAGLDERCRLPFAVQTFAADAPATICSRRRISAHHTRPTVHAVTRVAQEREKDNARASTRPFEAMKSFFHAVEEFPSTFSTWGWCETRSGGAVHHVQYVDKQRDSLNSNEESQREETCK